jgi:hypothetical protein
VRRRFVYYRYFYEYYIPDGIDILNYFYRALIPSESVSVKDDGYIASVSAFRRSAFRRFGVSTGSTTETQRLKLNDRNSESS